MSETLHQTKTILLDAAEELFSQHGYAAVGIRDIVTRAGVNLAAIKYHFGGKGQLYKETVRRALKRRKSTTAWEALCAVPDGPAEAATMLREFIHAFLYALLVAPDSEVTSSLILHEASDPTDALDFVIQDFIQPHEDALVRVIAVLLPEKSRHELSFHAQSILGQILHYRTFRPFMERMAIGDPATPSTLDIISNHITRFSLLGIGCPESMIHSDCEAESDQKDSCGVSRSLR